MSSNEHRCYTDNSSGEQAMSSPQFSIRIPPELDQQLKVYASTNGLTKSQVMLNALSYYLGLSEEVPLAYRMSQLEDRIARLEQQARG